MLETKDGQQADAGPQRTRSAGRGGLVTSGKTAFSLSLALGTVKAELGGHQWAPDLAHPTGLILKGKWIMDSAKWRVPF